MLLMMVMLTKRARARQGMVDYFECALFRSLATTLVSGMHGRRRALIATQSEIRQRPKSNWEGNLN